MLQALCVFVEEPGGQDMTYTQLSRTTPILEAWQDITDEQNDAQTAAIYDVIGKHGGNVLTVGFSPSQSSLVSVIEYPDELSAQRSVAGILALRTLEFQSIEQLWDVAAWVSLVREANQAR
jgi:phosphohistidine phosphatase SixA